MGASRSLAEREAIVAAYDALRREDIGYGAALTRVAEQFGVGTASVGRYVRARRERGTLERRPVVVPPAVRKLTTEDEAALVAWALATPEDSLYALQQRLKSERRVEVSEMTIRRALHRAGLKKSHLLKEKRKSEGPLKSKTRFGPQHRRPSIPKGTRMGYPSDVTDAEWGRLAPLLRAEKVPVPRKYELRDVVDALLYQTRTGCAWRYLPHDLPPWQTVMRCLTRWQRTGVLDRVHAALRTEMRVRQGKAADATAAIVDSQTVKSAGAREQTGYDAGKKTRGRKRHIAVDTMGLLLAVVVHAADIQDRDGGHLVVNQELVSAHPNLKRVYADAGYAGPKFEQTVNNTLPLKVEIVLKPQGGIAGSWQKNGVDSLATKEAPPPTFQVPRKRWIVERTLGWLPRWRRLARDYEHTVESSRGRVLLAMVHRMAAYLGVDRG